MIRFTTDNIEVKAAEDETGQRTIDAIAVPYNTFATVSDGTEVSFLPGSLKFERAPRVFMFHDPTKVVGIVAETVDTPEAMLASMKLANTVMASEALELSAMGAFSVSVGVNPTKSTIDAQGRIIVAEAEWTELSLVPTPAFAGATITRVAASAETPDTTEPATEQVEETNEVDTPEVVEAAQVPTPTPIFAQPTRQFRLPSAAEYLAAMYVGGSDFAQLNANIRAAAGDVVVSDSVVPEPIVQPLFDDINAQRPVVSALGVRAMPQLGKVFIRPRIKTHVEVSEQQTELTGVAARTMEVEEVQVTKKTFSGQATLSEQVIDWSDPSMLTSVLNDLTAQYSLATESEAIDTMAAAIDSNNREVTDLTDPVEVINDIFGIAAAIASVGNYLPTHIIVSPSVWAKLGSLKGTNDQQIFPMMTTTNNMGVLPGGATAWNGNPLGLQLVVSNQIKTQSVQGNDAKDYLFLANARFMENYEQQKGALSIEVGGGNAVLGRTVAFRGYFASVVMDSKLVWALGPAV